MMFYLKCNGDINQVCVLLVSPEVLDWEGTVVTDGNAASEITRFYAPKEGISKSDFQQIKATYWTDLNPITQDEKKRVKCAEILVPWKIPPEEIVGVVVPNETVQKRLLADGFDKRIYIYPQTFFLQGGEQF